MLKHLNRIVSTGAMLALLGAFGATATHGATTFSDDFTGTTLDSTLWSKTGGTIALDGSGNVDIQAASGDWSGAAVVSKAGDLNFYDQPLTFHIDGLTFGGAAAGSGKYAMDYLAVGAANTGTTPDQTWMYRPTSNTLANGIVLAVRFPSESSAPYELLIDQFAGGSTVGSWAFGMDALPTGITLTLDGSAGTYVVTLGGANFKWGGDADGVGHTRTAALPTGWTESSFDLNGTYLTRMAFGAFNNNSVTTPSSMTVGSASVSTVPEPATLGLVGVGLAVMVVKRRRR